MNTDNYLSWQNALLDRDKALYSLLLLAFILVGSYLITYMLPPEFGKRLRVAYEVGGILLYIGIVAVCAAAG